MIPLHDDVPTRRFAVVTLVVILLNVAVFAFELTLPRYGMTLGGFYAKAGATPFELAHGLDVPPGDLVPWWATLFTSMFIHGGWLHLIFNMLYLWIFGNNVEDALGRARFLGFYLACGLVATAAQVLTDTGSTAPMIGASGAVAGVLGAYLVLYPRARGAQRVHAGRHLPCGLGAGLDPARPLVRLAGRGGRAVVPPS